jgi:predicted nucleotidyltransferase
MRASSGPALQREQIISALGAVSDELASRGMTGELCLFGGAVMVLAFTARVSTKDVDAIFQPSQTIREVARRVAEEQDLPTDWLNDGVKGFVSARHNTTAGNLPQFPNLRLSMPVPEYLLAMKCMAARLGGPAGEASDVPDIIFLAKHLHLKTADDVLKIVAEYYPKERIPVKTQYLVEGLFEEGKL